MKTVKTIIIIVAAAFIAIQFVPVNRDNPAGPDTFNAPADVKKIIERSCYDCHSNKTRWPWYAHVAPVSWAVAGHVHEGRRRLNFSNWQNMPAKNQWSKREILSDEIEEGGMPLPQYLPMHPDARLSEKEKQAVYKWARSKDGAPAEVKEDDKNND